MYNMFASIGGSGQLSQSPAGGMSVLVTVATFISCEYFNTNTTEPVAVGKSQNYLLLDAAMQ